MPKIQMHFLIQLLVDLTQSSGSTKGQEERDIYFGRVFGLMAFVKSNILATPQSTLEDAQKIVDLLLEYAHAKIYLRAIAFQVLVEMMPIVKGQKWASQMLKYLVEKLVQSSVNGPEELWILILLQDQDDFVHDWKHVLPEWHNGKILHPKNLPRLTAVLKVITTMN